ncbi:MAG TPA: ABC transporter permease [Blastocatellia bacterium]|nr:ABC transporter permease [Blastocatellia bacterium]
MNTLLRDLRYAVRMLAKRPAFTVVAVLALALGIGANTAIFSVVNAVLLRPMPYENPDQLIMLWETNPRLQLGFDEVSVAPANYVDWKNQNSVFEQLAAFWPSTYNITDAGQPERLEGVEVSSDLFSLLGVQAARGRTFSKGEDELGNHRVVVVSHGLWQRRFASDPELINRTIKLNGEEFTVVGVMPEGFQFPRRTELPAQYRFFPPQPELWTPLAFTPARIQNRGTHNIAVMGRLKSGVTIDQARAEMSSIASHLAEQYPRTNRGFDVLLTPLHDQAVGRVKPALLILFSAVGLVLMIACANVANLLLARAATRKKEVAIRTALGAGRRRLVRQFLTESVLLAFVSGILGLLLALWGIDILLALAPENLPRLHEVSLDIYVLGFTLLVSLVVGVAFGLAPAYQASKPDLTEALKEGARGSAVSIVRNRTRSLLVVAEIALSLVLLVGAGLLIKSFIKLQQVDPGFNPERVFTIDIALPDATYPEADRQLAFFDQALDKIAALPGVESAAISTSIPFSGSENSTSFSVEGSPPADQIPQADYAMIGPGFFNTMGIPFVRGRDFTERDNREAPQVVIVSKSLAEQFFPGADAIGKRLNISLSSEGPRPSEIVGIVGDVKYSALNAEQIPALYLPHKQFPGGFVYVVVRSASDPSSLAASVRGEVWTIDKNLPVSSLQTMEQLIATSVASQRFNMLLLVIFAAVALVLAAVGIYGVMSYSVTQRTHEIGIRMALGAQAVDVLALVVRQGMGLAFAGVGVGLCAAFVLTRFMQSLLFGVAATDAATFILISLLLTAVAIMASYFPARRATRVDPLVALRYE